MSNSELPKIPSDLKQAVSSSDTAQLKHVETQEKNKLPTAEDLEQEKQAEQFKHFKSDLESFEASNLKKVETLEKNPLPTSDDVLKEKAPKLAAEFDQSKLKHVEPEVKTDIVTVDE